MLEIQDIIYVLISVLVFIILVDYIWLRPRITKKESQEILKNMKKSKPIKNNWDSAGIVMIVDNDNVNDAVFTVACLRKIGCKLPICFYTDDNNILKKFGKIHPKTTNINAIISSPFRHVMFLEPGVVFLKNPDSLFNSNTYQKNSCMFWKKTNNFGSVDFIRKLIPYNIPDNPILMKTGTSCCDARVVLIDKTAHIQGLQKLNVLKDSEYFENNPEIYWVAFELAKEPYSFIDGVSSLGKQDLFKDEYGNPLWLCIDSSGDLDTDWYSDSRNPLDYFKKTFNGNFRKNELTENEKEILNVYKKILFEMRRG